MRVKIIPHGVLRKTWPLDYECEAGTAAEAINALERNHNLKPSGGMRRWLVRLIGFNTEPAIYSPLRVRELHVVPEFSGGGGVVKILIGAVIAVAGIVASFIPGLNFLSTPLIMMGASFALGGILELLTPSPPTVVPNNVAGSNYLGAPQNTVTANTRIPIGFGRFAVYGQYLSFNVQADLTLTGANPVQTVFSGF